MDTITRSQSESAVVKPCPICGGRHEYNLRATIEETVGVMHMMVSRIETRSCTVVCPEKKEPFLIEVPVSLWSGQSLKSLK